jgi:hypothetical protein
VGTRCLDGKAEAREGQQQEGDGVDAPAAVGSRMRAAVEKGNIAVFFLKKSCHTEGGAEKNCWARSQIVRQERVVRKEHTTDAPVPVLSYIIARNTTDYV